MSNRFSATLQNCMKTDPDMALSNLYYRLFQSQSVLTCTYMEFKDMEVCTLIPLKEFSDNSGPNLPIGPYINES